jgi:hypothetical protein
VGCCTKEATWHVDNRKLAPPSQKCACSHSIVN